MQGRHVLLTGATDGIGRALAGLLDAEGWGLHLVGRRPLEDVADEVLTERTYVEADLARADAVDRVEQALAARGVTSLDLLVHNAAVASYGPFEDEAAELTDAMLDVNLWAPIGFTHRLLPRLEAARGTVVFVGSVATHLACPEYATYAATKAALAGFARNLRTELGRRVDVRVVHPGAVATGMHAKAGVPPELVPSSRIPSAEAAARRILSALRRRRAVRSLGMGPAVLGWAGRNLGSVLDASMRRSRR